MKVQRNKRYAVRKRKNYTALKVTTVLLTLLVIAAGTVFVWSLLKTEPQTASTEPSSSQGSVESKANVKVESSEISEDIPKRDPK